MVKGSRKTVGEYDGLNIVTTGLFNIQKVNNNNNNNNKKKKKKKARHGRRNNNNNNTRTTTTPRPNAKPPPPAVVTSRRVKQKSNLTPPPAPVKSLPPLSEIEIEYKSAESQLSHLTDDTTTAASNERNMKRTVSELADHNSPPHPVTVTKMKRKLGSEKVIVKQHVDEMVDAGYNYNPELKQWMLSAWVNVHPKNYEISTTRTSSDDNCKKLFTNKYFSNPNHPPSFNKQMVLTTNREGKMLRLLTPAGMISCADFGKVGTGERNCYICCGEMSQRILVNTGKKKVLRDLSSTNEKSVTGQMFNCMEVSANPPTINSETGLRKTDCGRQFTLIPGLKINSGQTMECWDQYQKGELDPNDHYFLPSAKNQQDDFSHGCHSGFPCVSTEPGHGKTVLSSMNQSQKTCKLFPWTICCHIGNPCHDMLFLYDFSKVNPTYNPVKFLAENIFQCMVLSKLPFNEKKYNDTALELLKRLKMKFDYYQRPYPEYLQRMFVEYGII
jgi:hypothetical protein